MDGHESIEEVCPLCNHAVEDIDCILCMDAANGEISEELIPEDMRFNPGWRDICRQCPTHLLYDEENSKLSEESLRNGLSPMQ